MTPAPYRERTFDFEPLVIDVEYDESKFDPRSPLYPFNITARSSGGELKGTIFGNTMWFSPEGPLETPPSFEYTGRALATVEELLKLKTASVEDHIKERLKLGRIVLRKEVQETVQEVEDMYAVSQGVPEETLKAIEEDSASLYR